MLECFLPKAEGLYNSAIFSSDGSVLVGRVFNEGMGYQALLVDEDKQVAFLLGSKKDESLYSVKDCNGSYVAVGHSGERSLILVYERSSGSMRSFVGPKGILWQVDCKYAVGGLEGKRWHLLIVDVKSRRAKALSARENIYAYSLARIDGGYVMVGRVGYEGNYDSFVLWTDTSMKPLKSIRSKWMENDYLRYTNGVWAVGRIELGGDSEGFVVNLTNLKSLVYRRQGFDYFRHMEGGFIWGEGEDKSHIRKALLVHDTYGLLLGEGFSAVRFYDGKSNTAYGYVYMGAWAYALRLRRGYEKGDLKYKVEGKSLKWEVLKLRPRGSLLNFTELNLPNSMVSYSWKDCKELY